MIFQKSLSSSTNLQKESSKVSNSSLTRVASLSLQTVEKKFKAMNAHGRLDDETSEGNTMTNAIWEVNLAPQALRDNDLNEDMGFQSKASMLNIRNQSVDTSLTALKHRSNMQNDRRRHRNSLGRLSTKTRATLMKELQNSETSSFLNELADIEASHGVNDDEKNTQSDRFDDMSTVEIESKMMADMAKECRLVS